MGELGGKVGSTTVSLVHRTCTSDYHRRSPCDARGTEKGAPRRRRCTSRPPRTPFGESKRLSERLNLHTPYLSGAV